MNSTRRDQLATTRGTPSSLAWSFNCASAQTTELVVNGSFETGSFAGWTAVVNGTPFLPWTVSMAGAGDSFSLLPTQPQDGQFAAWNGFDGSGPMTFTLHQDLKIPACLASDAILTWKDRVQWNFLLTGTATQPRTYQVQVRDIAGPVLATLENFSTGTAHVIGDAGWQTHTGNLAAYAGSNVRLWFQENIPEVFTGPGQLEIDAVGMEVASSVSIDNCCSTVRNRVVDSGTGTTLQQMVTELADRCTVAARNHGDFVSCVTRGLNGLRGDIITGEEKGAITRCAAQSSRGKKY